MAEGPVVDLVQHLQQIDLHNLNPGFLAVAILALRHYYYLQTLPNVTSDN